MVTKVVCDTVHHNFTRYANAQTLSKTVTLNNV